MPGLQEAQPLVGNTNALSILKALRYKPGSPLPRESQPFKLPEMGGPPDSLTQHTVDVYNQARRLLEGTPTGIGKLEKDTITGKWKIPENTYRKVVGGHAGEFLNLLRYQLSDTLAPIQSLGAWVDRILMHTGGGANPVADAQTMLQNTSQHANRLATRFQKQALATLKTDHGMDVPGALDDWYYWRNIRVQMEKGKFGNLDPNWFKSQSQATAQELKTIHTFAKKYGVSPDDMRTWFEGASTWYTQEVMNPLLYMLRDSGMLTDERAAKAVTEYDHYAYLERVGVYNTKVASGKM